MSIRGFLLSGLWRGKFWLNDHDKESHVFLIRFQQRYVSMPWLLRVSYMYLVIMNNTLLKQMLNRHLYWFLRFVRYFSNTSPVLMQNAILFVSRKLLFIHMFKLVICYESKTCKYKLFLWYNYNHPSLILQSGTDEKRWTYYKTSNIRRNLVGNKIVDHSDVAGASPVGAALIISSFST